MTTKEHPKIILTAGHRGAGTGANGYIDEGKEAIRFRNALCDSLRKRGVNVITDNDNEKLGALIKRLNTYGRNCIAMDFHFNASVNKTAHGCEVLVYEKTSDQNRLRAEQVCQTIEKCSFIYNRGVKNHNEGQHERLAYLQDLNCPSMIVELCFVTNVDDVDKYKKNFDELVYDMAELITSWIL